MRLIDADALKQPIGSYNPIKYTYEYGSVITVADIDTAPTITDKEIVAEFLKQGTFKIHIPEPEPFTEPVKTGKWIDIREESDGTGNRLYECSECHHGDIHYPSVSVPYCWYCGAKMENE